MKIRHLATLTVFSTLLAGLQAQTPKETATNNAVTKATSAAEAVLKKLPSLPGASDAKVINIHIGDIFTFGFDEGIDAEEWGMVDNQNESVQAATPGQGATPANPKTVATPAPHEKPATYRKIDFRKGDVVMIATEQPVDAPKPAASPSATPAEAVTPSPSPTPTPHAPATHPTEKPATPSVP